MIVGVPKEIKTNENRIAIIPAGVELMKRHRHTVLVEKNAGVGSGFSDQDFIDAGATTIATADEVYKQSNMIIKVKEPQPQECSMLREDQILFTYLHLVADPEQAKSLLDSGCIAIAYETVTGPNHTLPLLAPMSEVAGRLSIQAGAHCLEKAAGGEGVLLAGDTTQ